LYGNNQTLKAEGYGILKVILLVYLLGHLFTQAGVTVNHNRHAIISHYVSCPSLME
jgi:hypothetical protein